MKRFAFFKFFPADFRDGSAFMTNEEVGAYIRLLCLQWSHGPIPDDPKLLEIAVPGVSKVWSRVRNKFRDLGDGTVLNDRLEEERIDVHERSEKNSEAGRKGGIRAAATKRKPSERSSERYSDCSSERSSDAQACQSQSQSQSQISESESQIPNAAHSVAPTCGKPQSKPKAKDPLRWSATDGWQDITEHDYSAWSKAYPACNLERQLAAADQWLRANPKKATKSRWRAFVVNWLSRSQDRGGDERTTSNGFHPHQTKPTVEQKAAALADLLTNAPRRIRT